MNNILEATRLSASSYGLQPYNIIVVSNPETKQQLLPAAYWQTQITDSSQLLVFSIWQNISDKQVGHYINDIAATRGISAEALKGFSDTILGTVKNLSTEQQQTWASKQAYIALGTALIAASEQQVDATPMEGFIPEAFDTILGLKEKGLKSVVVLAFGSEERRRRIGWCLKSEKGKRFYL